MSEQIEALRYDILFILFGALMGQDGNIALGAMKIASERIEEIMAEMEARSC